MNTKVRVLVVDDSAFFRGRIQRALEETGEIQVIGQAADGRQAVALNERLRPDLITMDVEMPVLDGISAVREIMRRRPTDIIMFSSLTSEGARATLDALDAGAKDFLAKGADFSASGHRSSGQLLRDRVLALGRRRHHLAQRAVEPRPVVPQAPRRTVVAERLQLVVIGASTGGPVALQQVLTALPGDFPFPVLVAVHMPATFTPTFAERLNRLCALEVAEAADRAPLRPGLVLIAPGGRQTLVEGRRGAFWVSLQDSAEQIYKPSVDLCIGSAARVAGSGALAVVMTGMGADGKQGARLLREQGGHVWSQDAESCVVYGMPQAIERAGLSERVLPLDKIGPALAEVRARGSA
jgi:two-component system chemotaxis response regulator CheB